MSTGAALPGPSQPTVCYLTKRFPRLSETFILDEILGLEANGVALRLFAVADPGEAEVQPDVRRVRSPVTYLRSDGGARGAVRDHLRFLRGHATLLRRNPRRWWTVARRAVLWGRSTALVRHFIEAGGLAREMERVGGVHLHAAFAHGPASTAYFVHELTGRSFSFAAHAKDLYLSTPRILGAKIAASTFVLACSESAADELRRIAAAEAGTGADRPGDLVILAPHGVDVDRFLPSAQDAPAPGPPRPLRILAVGRLVPKKGYSVLIDALAALADQGVDFECRIVGDGNLRSQLQGEIRRHRLERRVELCGSRVHQEIAAEYGWADVFVQASVVLGDGDRDGIPNSVLEAMSSGVAVVATSVAGIPEVVHDGSTGLLVPPSDDRQLASAIAVLARNTGLRKRLGEGARQFVMDHHAKKTCIELPAALFLDRLTLGFPTCEVPA